jgi:predicted PhzF superfamily epimerase YddE/YHI9
MLVSPGRVRCACGRRRHRAGWGEPSLFRGHRSSFCFAQLSSNAVVDRAAINRAAWAATLSRAWFPHVFFFAGNLRDGGKLYACMWAPALGVEEDPATGSACAALVGAMASKPEFGGTAYRLSIQQGVSMGAEPKWKWRRGSATAW